MTNFEKIWDLLDKYAFKVDPQLSIYVTCVICENILLDACQGLCGCVYCKECIEKHLENGSKVCPGDNSNCSDIKLTKENLIKNDNSANRRVSKLNVKCPMEFCSFNGEMLEMVEHVSSCEKKQNQFEDLRKELNDLKNKYNELTGAIKSTKEQNEKQNSQLKQFVEDNLKKLKQEIAKIRDSDDRRDKRIAELERQIRELLDRPVVEPVVVSPEISVKQNWDIENIPRVLKKGAVVWSELFYSLNQEYLMRIWLHPNGSAVGTAAHISIEFCICDDADNPLLKWPIKCHITITLRSKNDLNIPPKTLSRSSVISKALFPQFSSEYFHFINSDRDVMAILQSKILTVECEAEISN